MSGEVNSDNEQLVDNDALAYEVQPHLDASRRGNDSPTGLEYINPALENDENVSSAEPSQRLPENGTFSNEPQTEVSNASSATHSNATNSVYFNKNEQTTAVEESKTRADNSSGTAVIQTRNLSRYTPTPRLNVERPLRMKHIKIMKAFAIVAVVIFFPLGIPAVYWAMRTEKEFNDGIERGDLDLARKFAKRTERLIIFSGLCALFVVVITFALIERALIQDDEYWEDRVRHRVMP